MRTATTAFLMILLMLCGAVTADTIDFGAALPGAPAGEWTVLTDQLAGLGVTFSTASGADIAWVGPTYGWEPARYSITPIGTEPGQVPWGVDTIRVDFSTPALEASIRGFDSQSDMDGMVLSAYDTTGTLVDSTSRFGQFLSPGIAASVSGSGISYLTVQTINSAGSGLFLDDLTFTPAEVSLEINIDIKPGNDTNPVNLRSKGLLRVAVLGSETFDVLQIDPDSLMLEGIAASDKGSSGKPGSLQDVNEDLFTDLMVQFRIADLGLSADTVMAELTGSLLDGTEFLATDSIRIIGGGRRTESLAYMQVQPVPEPTFAVILIMGFAGLIRTNRIGWRKARS